jgi:hypothetical protein
VLALEPFVMTARFARSFWKYRRHAKILRAILLDAGHLSQTFYLVCTQLGLGPYITAAIDDAELERATRSRSAVRGAARGLRLQPRTGRAQRGSTPSFAPIAACRLRLTRRR